MFSNISFILHKPQLSENIGACARAIKNFNFDKLILVDPKPSFPNDKIIATSVGAKDIIKKSKVFDSLEPAIEKIDYLIATTSRFRNKNIKHIQLKDLKKINYKKKIGFLFGSEASGLSNNEISYANYTMQIPTNSEFKSLNLSHSVILICYEIFKNFRPLYFTRDKKLTDVISKKKLNTFVDFIENRLEKKRFFSPREKKKSMHMNLRNIFGRTQLSNKELRILSSVFSKL